MSNKQSLIKTSLSFLSKKDYQYLVLLMLLIIVTAFVELAGVGSFLPYIKLLSDGNLVFTNHILHAFYSFLGLNSVNQFYLVTGSIIFFLILLKGVLSCANNYYQTKFTARINVKMSRFCLSSYLSLPYSEVINQNSSVLSKQLLLDVNYAVQVLTAILSILTDSIIGLSLIALVVMVNPGLVLTVAAFLVLSMCLVVYLTRDKMKEVADSTKKTNEKTYEVAAEALSGIKDVKAYRVESFFIDRYMGWAKKVANLVVSYNVITNLPGIAMNVVAFGCLLAVLLILMMIHGNLVAILPTLGIIAVAVQRLLPSTTRISTSLGIVRRFRPSVFVVRDAFDGFLTEEKVSATKQQLVERVVMDHQLVVENLGFSYQKGTHALSDISFTLKKNTSLGIVGFSGAGKSTLVDVLLGLLPLSSGDVRCDNQSIVHEHYAMLLNLVGYVPQQTHLLDASILENVAYGVPRAQIDREAIARALHIAQLEQFVNELPDGVDAMIGEKGIRLSGGQRQRIGIARALYRDPAILIMDEATSALDSVTERDFNAALRELMGKKTLIIIAHRHSSVKFCDQLLVLDQGKLVAQGSHDELIESNALYQKLYAYESQQQPNHD